MAMTKWDQDIHRIQEIQQLLESRQRYFRGNLETPNKLDSTGSSLSYPKLRSSVKRNLGSNQPSVGHSLDANFGSTDSSSVSGKDIGNNNDSSLALKTVIPAIEEIHDKHGALSDSSDGNCADHSQNESSDTNGSDFKGAAKKSKKKSAKALRKWVTKNVEKASLPSAYKNGNVNITAPKIGLRKSSIIRFKSSSIDKESENAYTTTTYAASKVKNSAMGQASPTTVSTVYKKKKAPNPVKLLRRRSWILKAEMASRLNEDASTMKLNNVITGLSKSSISQAREKLKKAEKSLRATVKNEQKVPALKKNDKEKQNGIVTTPASKPVVPKPRPVNRPALSRLLLRQKEDALKSDLNLREAFALIKIDPDPLLQLATTEEDSNNKILSTGKKFVSGIKKQALETLQKNGHGNGAVAADDTRATLSLQRLTKLSIQHSQMQQSLIPVTVPLKGKNELEKQLQNLLGKNVKPQGSKRNTSFSKSFETSRRKGSTASSTSQQKANTIIFKRRSLDRRTSIVPLSRLAGDTGTEKQNALLEGEHSAGYALDRLTGTII